MHEECADSRGIARGVERVAVGGGAQRVATEEGAAAAPAAATGDRRCRLRRRNRFRRRSAAGRRRIPCPARRPFARANSARLAMLAPRSGSARRAPGCRTPARGAADTSRRWRIHAACRARCADCAAAGAWRRPGVPGYPAAFSSAGGGGGGSSVAGTSLAADLRSLFSSFFCFLAKSLWRFANS